MQRWRICLSGAWAATWDSVVCRLLAGRESGARPASKIDYRCCSPWRTPWLVLTEHPRCRAPPRSVFLSTSGCFLYTKLLMTFNTFTGKRLVFSEWRLKYQCRTYVAWYCSVDWLYIGHFVNYSIRNAVYNYVVEKVFAIMLYYSCRIMFILTYVVFLCRSMYWHMSYCVEQNCLQLCCILHSKLRHTVFARSSSVLPSYSVMPCLNWRYVGVFTTCYHSAHARNCLIVKMIIFIVSPYSTSDIWGSRPITLDVPSPEKSRRVTWWILCVSDLCY